jgi:hypothetical protein
MRARVLGLLFGLVLWPARGGASQVAVFPLEARGVPGATADAATADLLAAVATIDNVGLVEAARPGKGLGVDLVARARACSEELFCLVELGEVLRVERVVVGHVAAERDASEGELELSLTVIDVPAAAVGRRLLWRVPALFEGALTDAVQAAARRLLASPDVRLKLELEPADAQVLIYGERMARPRDARELPFWSGGYYVRVVAPGHRAMELRLEIPRGQRSARLFATLAPQAPPKNALESSPEFAAAADPPGSLLGRTLPWVAAGLGAGLGATGAAMMVSAQADYNALSGQLRFAPGVTVPARSAALERDELRSRHQLGATVLFAGVGVVAASLVYLIVDRALAPSPSLALAPSRARHAPLSPAAGAVITELVSSARLAGREEGP